MKKNEIRKLFREKRNMLTDNEREKLQDLMLIRFQQMELPFLHTMHSFLPITHQHEIDPVNMIRWLSFRNPGLICAVPKADFSTGTMHHFIYDEKTEFELNAFGIPEPVSGIEIFPEAFDLVLTPLIGFDRNGQRVGYGKGFYDRFLALCRPDAICVGLSFFEPVDLIEDTNTFDRKMNFCITPERIYEFQ